VATSWKEGYVQKEAGEMSCLKPIWHVHRMQGGRIGMVGGEGRGGECTVRDRGRHICCSMKSRMIQATREEEGGREETEMRIIDTTQEC